MRLFIAIRFSEEIEDSLVNFQKALKAHGITGNYTKPENLHLTLVFIGEYPDPDAVLDAMETVPVEPFELRLSGTGSFHDLFWAGIEKSEELTAYVKRLRHVLAEKQIPFDRKKFAPHITLIRRMKLAGSGNVTAEILADILETVNLKDYAMKVEHISLMKSERGKHGMIYTELG